MGSDDNNSNYDYNPSLPAALIFGALFAIALFVHIYQALGKRPRAWWFWPLLVSVIMESEGYFFRYVSAKKEFTLWPLIVAQVSIVVAPAFLAAESYMIVGRMMAYVGSEHSIVRHSLITKIFVAFDIIAILSQSAGASALSSTDIHVLKTGFRVLVAALAFQVITFGFFLFVAIIFDVRSRRSLGEARRPLQPLFTVFYVSSLLIIGRSIYRTIEFASVKFTPDAAKGYVLTHEWPFYVFDSVPIFLATIAWSVIHPKNYLPATKGLRIDGTYEPETGCCGRRSKAHKNGQASAEHLAMQPADRNMGQHV